jgi:diguanylate cyclase (GGDEF)-like protein
MSSGWAAQQLTELLAQLGTCEDVPSAVRTGLDRASEAFEAEAGVVVRDGEVLAAVGFGGSEPPADWGVAGAPVPGLGELPFTSAPFDGGWLALAREGDPFTVQESALLRGVAQALSQTVRSLELVQSLRNRQELLERLAHIQRSIVQRSDLEGLLNAIVTGAGELVGGDVITLRLLGEGGLRLAAAAGVDEEVRERLAARSIDVPIPTELQVYENPEAPFLQVEGLRSVLSAPVLRNGKPCGVLSVCSRSEGRFGPEELEAMVAFAEHASLALTDAHNHADAVHRALHDPLTNLPNRSLFVDRLRQAELRAARAGTAVGVLFLDLDGFKTINDSLGHGRGDELLVAVATRLAEALRAGDTAARLGGDEFAVLVDGLNDERETVAVAQRMLEALRAPIQLGSQFVTVRASIGVATARGPGEDLLRDADLAMYQAKAQGRDRIVSFDCGMHAATIASVALEHDLRQALEHGELWLAFQPVVDLDTGAYVAAEALCRWTRPPLEFIPVAEETGLIVPLGAWVLQEACRTAASWPDELRVGVNVSSVQLRSAEFVTTVADALAASGLRPDRLMLELTESVLMEDVQRSAERLRALQALGVRIAIDDFGTGHSSLEYLHQLPLDSLKIPKPFVDDVDADGGDLARAIVDLGRSFGLTVVAEGIETEAQWETLRELGCTRGQGFLFAKPMSAEELLAAVAV